MCKTIRLLLEHCSHHHRLNGAVLSFARAICVVIVAVAMIATGATAGAIAAEAVQRGIIAPGDAAVTGFSGAVSPAELPPGADPVPATVINLDGPTVRVIDLKQLGGPPAAQIVPAPKPYTATARQTGQVFGVALDNAVPPNIYVAATSVFGLPIVAAKTGSNGEPGRLFTGVPGAKFMPGLWGPAELGGGPGSIWRIDGASGSISLLANVKTGGVDNAGPALGGLAYHWSSNSLFVADRESGLIHRVGLDGTQRNSFDHGVIGRQAQGLDPVPDSPSQRLEITSPEFKNGDPLSWRLAPAARRIFGLGIRSGRLYYAVAYGLEIWSVGVSADGEFANDATFEMAVPLAAADAEISKIIFDDEGRMILAERAEPTGAAGFDALTAESSGRVLRYAITGHEPGKPRIWQQIPDSYAIGFPSGYRNGNGGVAIGFDYGADGIWQRTSCGGFLWSTGERLRKSADVAIADDLRAQGPEFVDGLQGNRLGRIRPQNEPPEEAYFIDFDDRYEDARARGHMADLAIWRVCGPILKGGWMWETWWLGWQGGGFILPPKTPPPQSCPPSDQKPGLACCPYGTTFTAGQCKPWCPNGGATPWDQKLCGLGFDNATFNPANPGKLKCIGGGEPDLAKGVLGCASGSPIFSAAVCQAGYAKQAVPGVGNICWPLPEQLQCGPGQQVSPVDNKCHKLCSGTAWPTAQCCASGAVLSVTGQCCPQGAKADPKTGQCTKEGCPVSQIAKDGTCCHPGSKPNPKTGKCIPVEPGCPIAQIDLNGNCCPKGSAPEPNTGECEKHEDSCPPGQKTAAGVCCMSATVPDAKTGLCTVSACPAAQAAPDGSCCPQGWSINKAAGGCCPPGQAADPNGACTFAVCPLPGKLSGGKCCSPADLMPGGACASQCGPGKVPIPGANGCCDASLVATDASGAQRCCPKGPLVGGKCPSGLTGTPANPACAPNSTDPNCCAEGYSPAGAGKCCLTNQLTSGGLCCPAGQSPQGDGKDTCGPTQAGWSPPDDGTGDLDVPGFNQCCMSGTIPAGDGSCCAPNMVTSTGVCCPAGQAPNKSGTCGALEGTPLLPSCSGDMVDGQCCPAGQATKAGKRQTCCPDGLKPDPRYGSTCVPSSPQTAAPPCEAGTAMSAAGVCCGTSSLTVVGQCCSGGTAPGPDRSSCVHRDGTVVPFVPFLPTWRPSVPGGCGPRFTRDPRSGTCVPNTIKTPSAVEPVRPASTPPAGCVPPAFQIKGMCCPSRQAYDRGQCGGAPVKRDPAPKTVEEIKPKPPRPAERVKQPSENNVRKPEIQKPRIERKPQVQRPVTLQSKPVVRLRLPVAKVPPVKKR